MSNEPFISIDLTKRIAIKDVETGEPLLCSFCKSGNPTISCGEIATHVRSDRSEYEWAGNAKGRRHGSKCCYLHRYPRSYREKYGEDLGPDTLIDCAKYDEYDRIIPESKYKTPLKNFYVVLPIDEADPTTFSKRNYKPRHLGIRSSR